MKISGGRARARRALAHTLGGAVLLTSLASAPGLGQQGTDPGGAAPAGEENGVKEGVNRFANDERRLWTSAEKIRTHDAPWLLMLGGATAGLMLTDHTLMQHNQLSPANMQRSADISNYGVGALVGAGAGLYLWGKIRDDDHKKETGLLSAESALNALVVTSLLQQAFGRERPGGDAARGGFFRGGTSFPSNHSAVAWSIASMIAHEYPGRLTKVLAYGMAGAVSASRLGANAHFPSDVLVGGALGYAVAGQMYHQHHDPEAPGAAWAMPLNGVTGARVLGNQNVASPYVPLDSWVYPAMARLAALGYTKSQFLSSRPWTRKECARLLDEARERFEGDESASAEASAIFHSLTREFGVELGGEEPVRSIQLESVYTRIMGISGQPLNDSYHFGQTLINDFGRPYTRGFDPVSGVSGWADWGRFAIYARGEYQHAPSAAGYPQSVQDLIAQMDVNPIQSARSEPTINRFQLLDAYALTKFGGWDVSFGKQSLWWGPNQGGSLLMSSNAEPMYMLHVGRDEPFTFPFMFRALGPVKVDAFIGELAGNQFPPHPFFHAENISFKPTPNLELGFSRMGEFAGAGRALTWGALFNTYFASRSSMLYPAWDNPGQRDGGFSVSYRVPRLRDWLTVYATALSRDDPTPLVALTPLRAAVNPGFYLTHVPHVRRLDLRAEWVDTDPPAAPSHNGTFMYWEGFYHDLYTNNRNLFGDWIGRSGKGVQAWSTYWFGPRTSLQFGYRQARSSGNFIPGGDTINDGSVRMNWQLGGQLTFSAFVQYENWLAPALASRANQNVTTALQFTFWPQRWGVRR